MEVTMPSVELYQEQADDPLMWIYHGLSKVIKRRHALDDEYPEQSREVFQKFLEEFQHIEISAGLPRNDPGQTITLSEGGGNLWQPKVGDQIDSLSLPDRLDGYGNCFRIRREDARKFLEEEFLFEYSSGFRPSTFAELTRPIGNRWFREVSDILHLLTRFEVGLMEKGTVVKMQTLKKPSNKPPFVMGW
jgi:hypothetical protein